MVRASSRLARHLAACACAAALVAGEGSYGQGGDAFTGIEINRIGDYSHQIREYQDVAIENALAHLAAAAVPRSAVRQVTIEAYKGAGVAMARPSFGLTTSHRLWIKVEGCPSNLFLVANFAGRITSVTDEAGCLARASGG